MVPPALRAAQIPDAVLEVLDTLGKAGHRSWLVGGAVRDLLLHHERTVADYDVATPARPEAVAKLFRKVIPTGIAHGTVTVLTRAGPIEVTTFRGEGAYADGRRPDSVTFLGTIEEDLARRDFTVNALAFDPLRPDFTDPYGGLPDLEKRLLRAVGDAATRFGEDGLRPLRAARFAAQLGFDVEAGTEAAIGGALPIFKKVSAERVAAEMEKLLLARHPRRGLSLLRSSGLLGAALPPLASLSEVAFVHAAVMIERLPADFSERLAGLLHCADPDPAVAAKQVEAAAKRLKVSNEVRDEVVRLTRENECLLGPAPGGARSDAQLRRWLARVGKDHAPAVLRFRRADAHAAGATAALERLDQLAERIDAALAAKVPLCAQDLALNGAAVMSLLGVPPGRAVGEALAHLLDRVLEDPDRNTRAALEAELTAWWAVRPKG
jgi:tRNA nucleotidyltransferase (CCA-adding enzyme)